MHQVTQLNHLASPCKKNVEEEEEEEMHGGASVAKKEEAQRMLSSLSSLAGRPPARLFVSRGRGRGGTASHLLTQTRCPPARSRTHGKENEAAGGGDTSENEVSVKATRGVHRRFDLEIATG